MRRGGVIWGLLLIALGVLFLLNTLGIFEVNAWQVIWPLALVLGGVSILVGGVSRRDERVFEGSGDALSIPLEGAQRAHIDVRYGAGKLRVRGGTSPGELVAGTFGWGLDYDARRSGDSVDVRLSAGGDWWERMWTPWRWFGEGVNNDWNVVMNGDVPLSLDFQTGASESVLDLTRLKVSDFKLQTGASSTQIDFPAGAGHTRATIRSGAAEVKVRVPDGVAARIRTGGGLAEFKVDESRFPRSGDVYQSPDYDSAEHKLDLDAETGLGEISVR